MTRTWQPGDVAMVTGSRKPWLPQVAGGLTTRYADINAVKILSDGVSADE